MLIFVSAAFAGGLCDADGLAKGAAALGAVEQGSQPQLAATALSEACRFPGVGDRLEQLGRGAPRIVTELSLIAAVAPRFEAACEGGVSALAGLAGQPHEQSRASLYAQCKPAFATSSEWTEGTGFLAAPILFYRWLLDDGVDPAVARVYGRALAGISDPPQDHAIH